MKSRHTAALALAIMTLSAAAIGSARYAHAQDAEEALPSGCLVADVDDEAEGTGNVIFLFQDSIEKPGYFSFYWNAENFAYGPMAGSIIRAPAIESGNREEIEFYGNAGNGCTVTGSGKGEDWDLSGKFEFHGKCAKFFKGGTFFSVPYIYIECAGSFGYPIEKNWQASD